MPTRGKGGDTSQSPLDAQINLILNGDTAAGLHFEPLEDAAAYPDDWSRLGEVDYLYRKRTLLVRDADIEVVRAIVDCVAVARDNNIRGLTQLELTGEDPPSVQDACDRVDRELGEGVVTPDHVFYLCTVTACPAAEPLPVPPDYPPDPGVSAGPCDGRGAHVRVLDSGWLTGASQHYWLAGVDGEADQGVVGSPAQIHPYAGHGTFVAGVVRAMAPRSHVRVGRLFTWAGASFESDVAKEVSDALKAGADIISMDFGTNTRKDIASLGFDVVGQMLLNYPGVVLVAAAGNDSSRRPFWPAAFPWAISVGALSADGRSRASFTNHGPWVDVYAPGEELINAFATGRYVCIEPPDAGQVREFTGMARWSGTSFATPIVSGLIAARMSGTGLNAPQAASELLARARAQAVPGVGPVLFPGQACDDQHGCGCCDCGSRCGRSCDCHECRGCGCR